MDTISEVRNVLRVMVRIIPDASLLKMWQSECAPCDALYRVRPAANARESRGDAATACLHADPYGQCSGGASAFAPAVYAAW